MSPRKLAVWGLMVSLLFIMVAGVRPAAAGGDTGIATGDSTQVGYTADFTGSGTITSVQVNIDTLPSMTLTNPMYFILNTGDLNSCSGFMQDIVDWESSLIGWKERYFNGGNTQCTPSLDSNQANPQIASGDRIWLEIFKSGTTTYYYIEDLKTGSLGYQSVTSLSTWNKNDFQTMTESTSGSGNVPAFYYNHANFTTSSSTYPIGGSSTTVVGTYGGACALSNYALGSWLSSFHGYLETSFDLEGYCTNSYTTSGHFVHGSVNNPSYAEGTPNSQYAVLLGPNSGDGAYLIVSFSQAVSGHLCLFGYSYNNGGGAYYTNVVVSVSTNDASWTKIYSSLWNPSSNNMPVWTNVGSISGIEYVNVTAWDNPTNGDSAYLELGAVAQC